MKQQKEYWVLVNGYLVHIFKQEAAAKRAKNREASRGHIAVIVERIETIA